MSSLQSSTALMSPTQLHFHVHDAQKHILAATERFLVLDCGRRFGKDHLIAIKTITHSFSHSSPRGNKRYAIINPVYNPQGKESFRVFVAFAESGGLVKKKIETPPMEVHLVNGDIIYFFSADNPDNLRGSQYDGVVINEAGLLSNLKEIWDGPVQYMLLDRCGWGWLTGTPKGKNAFHSFFLRGLSPEVERDGKMVSNEWRSFKFPTYANPFIPRAEIDRIKSETPEDIFSQEILGEFLDSGGTVFKGLSAMKARSQDMVLDAQADFCRVGIDVARHTDFTVCVALSPDGRVIGFDRFNQLDWETIKLRIKAFCTRYRGKVKIDTAGAGDPIYEFLSNSGIPITPAKFSNTSKTQWVRNLMAQIEDGIIKIPLPGTIRDPSHDTTHLWHELEAYTFEMLPGGGMRYGAPDGFHDDCVTALYLAASEVPPLVASTYHDVMGRLDLNDVREIGEASW